ncbi:ADP-ribosylglycohydrolase family protein [Pseudomonas sp.]|uniref:ADP-ribosylglycohydrolase family protein n=1 Tax=unclassified Pseudomonas TaxID=196821 RepID=UPI0028B08959|nr:ADP-ribosylglycohydrolase family protein [Pseudomonas sp.]
MNGGWWHLEYSGRSATDDGELALALARSIMASGGTYNCEAAAVAYVDWLYSSPFDMGGTTRQALTGPLRYPELSASDACSKAASLTSQANGALMRVAPIGIAAHAAPTLAASWARQDAVLTHPHPVCLEANAAYAAAIAAGIGSGRRQDMIEAALGVLGNGKSAQTVRGCLEAALEGHLPEEYQQQMGWVLIALQNAFYHLGAGDKAGHAIVETIRRGGDTDTNACIVGALVGAVDGLEGLENAWLQKLQSCRSHNESVKPRPIRFWPDDIFILAKALVTGSTPPS